MIRSLFIGRWQPLHEGHKALIQTALDTGNEVIVGIRDTAPSESDPYTVAERRGMIRRALGSRVHICVIPDFDEICYGRGVGYSFREIRLDEKTEAISGMAIRSERCIAMETPLIWLTGNSGAGKTTLAHELRKRYWPNAIVLDGDEMRQSISLGAGYAVEERRPHNLRVARLAKLLLKQKHVVIVAVIAPTESIRASVEQVVKPFWVYVKCNLPKRRGYFYDEPMAPSVTVDTDALTIEESAAKIWKALEEHECRTSTSG